jgi:hypothetical protein
VLWGIPCPAQEVTVDSATVTEYGLYEVADAPPEEGGGSAGRRVVDQWRLTEMTTDVPGRIGSKFGFQFVLKGKPMNQNLEIRFRISHPLLTNPETGESVESQEWSDRVNIGAVKHTAWSFDSPWEVSPGDWTIEVFYGERKLCGKTFHVMAADDSN